MSARFGFQTGPESVPVTTIQHGRLKAVIWEFEDLDRIVSCNVTFSRTYDEDDREFRATDRFGADDLVALGELVDEAHQFIRNRQGGAA